MKYEEAAEYLTNIKGWVCKKCRRYFGEDEHLARWCCATDLPCECGKRNTNKSYIVCENCHQNNRERREKECYDKREKREWDGKSMIYSDVLDHYYEGVEEAEDDADHYEMSMEDMHLLLCERMSPPVFELDEFVVDGLPECASCGDYADGIDEVEKIVNNYLKEVFHFIWQPGKYALKGYTNEV